MTAIVAIAFLPLGLAAGIWALRRPSRPLVLYAAVMPFGSSIAVPLGVPRSFSTLSSLLGLVAGVMLVRSLARDHLRPVPPQLAVPLWLFFVALAGLSVTWSINPPDTFDELMILASLVALYVIVALYPFSVDDVEELKRGIVAGTALTGLYGVVLAATSSLPTTGAGVARFQVTGAGGGEGGDPNITAAALILGFAVAVHAVFETHRTAAARLGYLGATALIGAGITLTASRGGLLAAGVVVVFTVLSQRRSLVAVVAIVLVTLPALLLIPETLAERVDNTGTSGRTEIWELAIASCPKYCPVGSGYGTFGDVHEEAFLSVRSASGNNLRYQAHSIWFESLIELGVVGALLMVAALLSLGRDLRRVAARARGGALAALVGLMITNSFLSTSSFKYFWLVIMFGTVVVNVHRHVVSPSEGLVESPGASDGGVTVDGVVKPPQA